MNRLFLSLFAGMVFLLCPEITPPSAFPRDETRTTETVPGLERVLHRTRESIQTFWGQFKSVTCVERVEQEKLGKQGRIEYKQRSTFDYLVLLSSDKGNLLVEESRLLQEKKGNRKNIPLMVTSGVPTLLLVFHSQYENSFTYRLDGYESLDGNHLLRIRFQHIPGTESTTALRLRGKDYPLEIQGTAWVNPETGTIHKITADLAGPIGDLNLKSLQMEVRYGPQEFPSKSGIYWLPSTAAIDIQTERQQWRNLHRYSSYKMFTVNTEDKVVSR